MLPTTLLALLVLSLSTNTNAHARAEPAFQKLNPRALYQGGWALALQGSASTTCPSTAPVLCPSTLLTPSCCPAGQTCINGAAADANYCCPTSADCNTAVFNFPQCANTTWTMLKDILGGYFCCEPGMIGVNAQGAGIIGPLCEPADQVVPASLLATVYPQATATPSSTPLNTTIPGGVNQTNPVASSTSTSNPNTSNPFSSWTTGKKIGVGIAAFAVIVLVLAACSFLNRRRARRGHRTYGPGSEMYDEYSGYGVRQGSEPYRRATPGNENNVTVNVVSGDQTR